MEYLGHFISNEKVQVDESKIAAMKNWPKPDNAPSCGDSWDSPGTTVSLCTIMALMQSH